MAESEGWAPFLLVLFSLCCVLLCLLRGASNPRVRFVETCRREMGNIDGENEEFVVIMKMDSGGEIAGFGGWKYCQATLELATCSREEARKGGYIQCAQVTPGVKAEIPMAVSKSFIRAEQREGIDLAERYTSEYGGAPDWNNPWLVLTGEQAERLFAEMLRHEEADHAHCSSP